MSDHGKYFTLAHPKASNLSKTPKYVSKCYKNDGIKSDL